MTIVDPMPPGSSATVVFPPGRRMVYRQNSRSMGKYLLSEDLRGVVYTVALDIAEMAKTLAPKGRGRKRGDNHRKLVESFEVKREGGVHIIAGNPRVRVTVVNHARHAAAVEFGSKTNRKTRFLARAGSAFGDLKEGEER